MPLGDLASLGASDEQLAALDVHLGTIHAALSGADRGDAGASATPGKGGPDAGASAKKHELQGFANPTAWRYTFPPAAAAVTGQSSVELDVSGRVFRSGRGLVAQQGFTSAVFGRVLMPDYQGEVHVPMGFEGAAQIVIDGRYEIDEVFDDEGTFQVHRGMELAVGDDGAIDWRGEARPWHDKLTTKSFKIGTEVDHVGDVLRVKLTLDATQSSSAPSVDIPGTGVSMPLDIGGPVNGHFEEEARLRVVVDGRPAAKPPTAPASAAPPVVAAAAAAAQASASASASVTVQERRPRPVAVPPPLVVHFGFGRHRVPGGDEAAIVAWGNRLASDAGLHDAFESIVTPGTGGFIDVRASASRPGQRAANAHLSGRRADYIMGLLRRAVGGRVNLNPAALGEDTSARPDTDRRDPTQDAPEQIVTITVHAPPR